MHDLYINGLNINFCDFFLMSWTRTPCPLAQNDGDALYPRHKYARFCTKFSSCCAGRCAADATRLGYSFSRSMMYNEAAKQKRRCKAISLWTDKQCGHSVA